LEEEENKAELADVYDLRDTTLFSDHCRSFSIPANKINRL